MKFESAYKGVRLLFWAEILGIISQFAILIASSAITVGGNYSLVGAFLVVAIIGVALFIAASIIGIVGYAKASKDEELFMYALIFTLAGIVISLLSGLFQNVAVKNWFTVLQNTMSTLTIIFSIYGLISLSQKMNDQKNVEFGARILRFIFVILILGLVLNIVSTFFKVNVMIAGILLICVSVLYIIAYFMYIAYLRKVEKMLK